MRADRGVGPVSGDGFVKMADGSRRWGLYGAAGLLVRHVDLAADVTSYVVALRSKMTHMGGTWAIPGGALNRDESPVDAAAREFREEIGIAVPLDHIVETYQDDHGGWSYWTVIVDVPERFELPVVRHWETDEVRWVGREDLGQLNLLSPFRTALVDLGILDLQI
jgi:8-oxo-dGTP diphosphatase